MPKGIGDNTLNKLIISFALALMLLMGIVSAQVGGIDDDPIKPPIKPPVITPITIKLDIKLTKEKVNYTSVTYRPMKKIDCRSVRYCILNYRIGNTKHTSIIASNSGKKNDTTIIKEMNVKIFMDVNKLKVINKKIIQSSKALKITSPRVSSDKYVKLEVLK